MHDALIGLTLAADCKRPADALPFLSESLLNHTVSLIQTAMDYFNVFFDKKDYRSAKDILHWEIAMLSDRNRDFTAALTDCLSGFTVVKTFKAEKEIFQLFAQGRPMRSSAAAAAENPRCCTC